MSRNRAPRSEHPRHDAHEDALRLAASPNVAMRARPFVDRVEGIWQWGDMALRRQLRYNDKLWKDVRSALIEHFAWLGA